MKFIIEDLKQKFAEKNIECGRMQKIQILYTLTEEGILTKDEVFPPKVEI